jgi:hypothetical protein
MGTGTSALLKHRPGRDTFYVVKQTGATPTAGTVTVLHHIPKGATGLAWFEDPNGALDFAEAVVRELRASGSEIELVDPPYGLVGTG